MTTKILINAVEAEEYRVAIIKEGLLDGFYIQTSTAEEKTRNIYKGVVERIQPSLQACFVNFGSNKNGFLQASEVHPEYYSESKVSAEDQPPPSVEKALKTLPAKSPE